MWGVRQSQDVQVATGAPRGDSFRLWEEAKTFFLKEESTSRSDTREGKKVEAGVPSLCMCKGPEAEKAKATLRN